MKIFSADCLFEKCDTCEANPVDHVELRRSYQSVWDHLSNGMKPWLNKSSQQLPASFST